MRLAVALALLVPAFGLDNAASEPAKIIASDWCDEPLPDGAVARLGSVCRGCTDDLLAIALSPDGRTVALATPGTGTGISFLDTATGKKTRRFYLSTVIGEQMEFTPDGKGLVVGSRSGITILDAETGRAIDSVAIGSQGDSCTTLSADGAWVAAQPRKDAVDADVGIWEVKTGKQVASLPGRGAWCKQLVFSHDKKRLLLCSTVAQRNFTPEPKVILACIDIDKRKVTGEISVGAEVSVALCQDGETVAYEDENCKSIHVRNLVSGVERCVIPVTRCRFAFTPDGKALCTIDESGQAALWDVSTGKKTRDLHGLLASKCARILGISRDGETIVALDGGGRLLPSIVVWNASTGKRTDRSFGHRGPVKCVAYSPDGKLLASGGIDQTMRLWNPATGEHLRILATHQDAITVLVFSPDGKLLASSSAAGAVKVCHVTDGKLISEFSYPECGVTALTFSKDSKVLHAGGGLPELISWDIATGEEVVRQKIFDHGRVLALANGGDLALAFRSSRFLDPPQRLQVWDCAGDRSMLSIELHDDLEARHRIRSATLSHDGRVLVFSQILRYGAGPDARRYAKPLLRVWDVNSGQPIRTLGPIATNIVAFSSHGRYLACGSVGVDRRLRAKLAALDEYVKDEVWDHAAKLLEGMNDAHEDFFVPIIRDGKVEKWPIQFEPEVDIWDTATGEKVAALPMEAETLAFSPDGLHLAAGGSDGTILIWAMPKIALLSKAEPPSSQQLDGWWRALGRDAEPAEEAIVQLAAAAEHSMKLFKERVKPVKTPDDKVVAKLIAQLDSEEYAERETAQTALRRLGDCAAHYFKKALEGEISLEAQRRLKELLDDCNDNSSVALQNHRAIAVIEWIGTPEAHKLLRTLADGDAQARLTIEARAALKRLGAGRCDK